MGQRSTKQQPHQVITAAQQLGHKDINNYLSFLLLQSLSPVFVLHVLHQLNPNKENGKQKWPKQKNNAERGQSHLRPIITVKITSRVSLVPFGSLWFPSVPVGYQLGTNGLTDWYPTGPLKLPCRDIQCHDRYQLLISRN